MFLLEFMSSSFKNLWYTIVRNCFTVGIFVRLQTAFTNKVFVYTERKTCLISFKYPCSQTSFIRIICNIEAVEDVFYGQ